jgi:nucleoside-diphosphate kinase
VRTGRQILGATRPEDSTPGSLRGDYAVDVGRNIVHGSDSVESANKELNLWFKEDELVKWDSWSYDWVYE